MSSACGADDLGVDASDGNVSVEIDGADLALGDGQGRPDWLEDWVVLPEGSEISMAIDDPANGDRVVVARVRDTTGDAILAHLSSVLEAQGYERLGETTYFAKDGEPVIVVRTSDEGTGLVEYSWEYANQSEEDLRAVYAPREGPGVLTLVVDGSTTEQSGMCILGSTDGNHFIGDASQASVDELEDGSAAFRGSVVVAQASAADIWAPADQSGGPESAVVELTSDGFVVQGKLANSLSSEDEPALGSITLVCEEAR